MWFSAVVEKLTIVSLHMELSGMFLVYILRFWHAYFKLPWTSDGSDQINDQIKHGLSAIKRTVVVVSLETWSYFYRWIFWCYSPYILYRIGLNYTSDMPRDYEKNNLSTYNIIKTEYWYPFKPHVKKGLKKWMSYTNRKSPSQNFEALEILPQAISMVLLILPKSYF